MLRTAHETVERAVIVHMTGEVDLITGAEFQASLNLACAKARPPDQVVADLSEVTFLGSSGLATLIDVDRQCRDQRTPLRVVASTPGVLRPLEVTGLDRILSVSESLDTVVLVDGPTPG